jgi:hypothetical protein
VSIQLDPVDDKLIIYGMQYSLYEVKSVKIHSPKKREQKRRILRIVGFSFTGIMLIAILIIVWSMWPSSPDVNVRLGTEGTLLVDGELVGVGEEFLLENLESGIHSLVAKPTTSIPFLDEDKLDLNLRLGGSETISMLSVSNLTIKSNPSSARVIMSSVNGDIMLGLTPIHTLIPLGQYEIKASLPGYPEYRQSVLVSGDTDLSVKIDLIKIALSRPGAKRLVNNLNISSLEADTSLMIKGETYTKPGLYAIEPGIHKLTLLQNQNVIITTEVVFPSIGKPVSISSPSDVAYPCLHFGVQIHRIPQDAVDLTVSQDKRILLYTTIHRYVYKHVNAVDLTSGELIWVSDISSSWGKRPVIIGSTDGSMVYGMTGVPPLHNAKPFILDIKNGFEEAESIDGESILPRISEGEDTSVGRVYAHVWSGWFNGYSLKTSLEVLIDKEGDQIRYMHVLDDGWTAQYLGCISMEADGKRPLFIFSTSNRKSFGLVILDISRISEQSIHHTDNDVKEKPEENTSPEWVTIKPPFIPSGVVLDNGFNLNNGIIIYNENTLARIIYPAGKVRWKRYFNPPPNSTPILRSINNRDVLLLTYDLSPFEIQMDIITGEDINKRTQPSKASEWYGNSPCGDGVYIKNNTVYTGIYVHADGSYTHQWERTFNDGALLPSLWGVLHVTDEKIDLLGSHGLESILTFSLPGFTIEENLNVISSQRHLVIHSGARLWIVDRDGLLKGYYPGVEGIERFDNQISSALFVTIADSRYILPWPE